MLLRSGEHTRSFNSTWKVDELFKADFITDMTRTTKAQKKAAFDSFSTTPMIESCCHAAKSLANRSHLPVVLRFEENRTKKNCIFIPVPGIEPGSFRCFKSEDMKAEYPSLWTIPEMVLLMKGHQSKKYIILIILTVGLDTNINKAALECI